MAVGSASVLGSCGGCATDDASAVPTPPRPFDLVAQAVEEHRAGLAETNKLVPRSGRATNPWRCPICQVERVHAGDLEQRDGRSRFAFNAQQAQRNAAT